MKIRALLIPLLIWGALSAGSAFASVDDRLAGTSWLIAAIDNGNNAVQNIIAYTEITAHFEKDGNLVGSAGCNRYFSRYAVTGEMIRLEPAASTRMICTEPPGVMQQEAHYLNILKSVRSYRMTAGRLDLLKGDGSIAVTMIAAEKEKTAVYCSGSLEVEADEVGESLFLVVNGQKHWLKRTPSASGKRYEGVDDPSTVFWVHGDEATLTLSGVAYPGQILTRQRDKDGKPAFAETGSQLPVGRWKVEKLAGKSLVPKSTITMEFTEDGRVTGKASINNYFSSWLTSDDGILIAGAGVTMMAGPEELMEQEQVFLSALQKVNKFEVRGDRLILSTAAGTRIEAVRER